jgi:microcystin degradation protein MlrC
MRIAVGGFQHETNTFAAQPATYADFEAPDAWPGLTRGAALFETLQGINLPAAGFVAEARSSGHALLPLTWCSATPSAPVTRDAYERISAMLLEDIRAARNLDAVYLDLHGAMVAEHVEDADGELLRRVRALVGSRTPIVASLDFHANVSELMVSQATALVAYRTYPHTDMSDSGVRALRGLSRIGDSPVTARLRQLPFLIPLTSQCTLVEPMQSLVELARTLERGSVVNVNFTPGFPAADVPECGPAVFGNGFDPVQLDAAIRELSDAVAANEPRFALEIFTVEAAVEAIERASIARGRPWILADTQDNPGGGGPSDGMSLIKALVERRLGPVLAGVVCDAKAASAAHAAGVGHEIDVALGGCSGTLGETPLRTKFTVAALGDGRFTATGPFYLGSRMDLGPMALLRVGTAHIAVASRKQQAADQAMFRHLGIEPRDFAVLALKSSVHFRADFGPIAGRILVVEAPGPNVADPARLPFRRLRPGVRLSPEAGPA